MKDKIFRFLTTAPALKLSIIPTFLAFFTFFLMTLLPSSMIPFLLIVAAFLIGCSGLPFIIRKESGLSVIGGYSTTIFSWVATLWFLIIFISKP
jgi:hypothetical protein